MNHSQKRVRSCKVTKRGCGRISKLYSFALFRINKLFGCKIFTISDRIAIYDKHNRWSSLVIYEKLDDKFGNRIRANVVRKQSIVNYCQSEHKVCIY